MKYKKGLKTITNWRRLWKNNNQNGILVAIWDSGLDH